jgi:hypothetical protein
VLCGGKKLRCNERRTILPFIAHVEVHNQYVRLQFGTFVKQLSETDRFTYELDAGFLFK